MHRCSEFTKTVKRGYGSPPNDNVYHKPMPNHNPRLNPNSTKWA